VKPRGLIIALVVSVAVNLFLAGLIVGGAVVARRVAEMRTPLWRAGDDLPPLKRRAFRQMFRQAGLETRDAIRQSRALRREAIAALEGPDYDAVVATRNMNQARALDTQARSQVEARILEFAATLTPEERDVLAQGLRRAMAGQLLEPRGRGERAPIPPPER
jgi:uncharacterized membrane protein